MPKFFLQKSQWLYSLLSFVLVFLFIRLALHCYYADSEIWLLTLSQKVFSPYQHMSIYYKWFFHLLTYLSTSWTNDNLWAYHSARFFFAAVSLLALILNSLVYCKIFENKKLFFPFLIINLTSSLFFNQAFRIRADIVALLIHTLFLWLVVVSPSKKAKNILVLITLNVFLILCTPKALIFLALQTFLGFLYLFRGTLPEQKELGRKILLSFFYPLSFLLFVAVSLTFLQPQHPLLLAVHSALNFYLKSSDPRLGGAAYFNSFDFMYLIRFLKNSPVHTLLFLFWLFSFSKDIFQQRKTSTLPSFFYLYSALLLSFILLYNQKLPFFLGPFLVPFITFQFGLFYHFATQKKKITFAPMLFLLAASIMTLKQYSLNITYNNNHQQKKFLTQLQNYKLKNPQLTIYDVIGLLPKNNSFYAFVGPGDVTYREQIFGFIAQQKPDIYLYTLKNIFFEPELNSFLQKNYFEESPGVWLKADHLSLSQRGAAAYEIIQIQNKNYWLVKTQSPVRAIQLPTKMDVTQDCHYLDENKKVSQKRTSSLAIPVNMINVLLVEAPPLKISQNPYDLFRYDTFF